MISLHCLLAISNKRTPGQFECDVTWFCFSVNFLRSHARCGYCSIVFWGGFGRGMEVEGASFKTGHPKSKGWKSFERKWTGGGRS